MLQSRSLSHVLASKRQRKIEATSDQVLQIMSHIQQRRTSESEFERAKASRVFKDLDFQQGPSPQEPVP